LSLGCPQWLIDLLKSQGRDWEEEFRTETDGEDCLFLDIAIPNYTVAEDRFAVLVWIYGGEYGEFLFLLRNGRN
jgi:carboxylesterase type B